MQGILRKPIPLALRYGICLSVKRRRSCQKSICLCTYSRPIFFPRLQAAEDDQRQHSEDMSKMEESLIMKDEIIRYNSTEIVLRKDIAHCSRETQSLILLLICRMSKKPANLKRSL